MRRVSAGGSGGVLLGPVFWAAKALPAYAPVAAHAYPLLGTMDEQTQQDAAQFAAGELMQHMPAPPKPAVLSERSIIWQQLPQQQPSSPAAPPAPVHLALVARDDGSPSSLREWASLCVLPGAGITEAGMARFARAVANGELYLRPGATPCNWSAPVMTEIPDSRAKTCAGVLPPAPAPTGRRFLLGNTPVPQAGQRFLLGNQLPTRFDRDPLTISLSRDGVLFDRVAAVRAGAPPTAYPGVGKGPGFQYPAAAVDAARGMLLVAYSVNKEDIAVTRVPLASLATLPAAAAP